MHPLGDSDVERRSTVCQQNSMSCGRQAHGIPWALKPLLFSSGCRPKMHGSAAVSHCVLKGARGGRGIACIFGVG